MSLMKNHINLLRGWPAPSLLPADLLSAACQRILTNPQEYTPILQYGPSAGHQPWREQVARWLSQHYRVEADPERICVSGGASQSLACVLQSFTDPNYTKGIWIIAPCYFLACGIFEDSGFSGKLRATPEDDEGVDLSALEQQMKQLEEAEKHLPQAKPIKIPGPLRKLYRHVIYAVPTCANPSGKTMSVRRREGLVKLARAYDALVICDDVYDFLQWPLQGELEPNQPDEMRLPRLCDIDRAMGFSDKDKRKFGNAISNGSFSKIAGPGVRTGWVEASPNFVTGLGETASTLSGGAPSQLCAAIIGDMLENGTLEKYIEKAVRPSLQRRHRLLMDAVRVHILPLGYEVRQTSLTGSHIYGGYFIWLSPSEKDALKSKSVADAALEEENLVFGYGNMFTVHGDEGRADFSRDFRLCFAWESEDNLVDGVQRLGSLIARMLANRERYDCRQTDSQSQGFAVNYG